MDSHAMRYGAAAWSAWRIAFFFAVILWLSRGVGCSGMGRRLWYTLLLRCNLAEYVGVVISMCAAFRTFNHVIYHQMGYNQFPLIK